MTKAGKITVAIVGGLVAMSVISHALPDPPGFRNNAPIPAGSEPTYNGTDRYGDALWTDANGTTWRCDSDHNCTKIFNLDAFKAEAAKYADADKAAIEAAQ